MRWLCCGYAREVLFFDIVMACGFVWVWRDWEKWLCMERLWLVILRQSRPENICSSRHTCSHLGVIVFSVAESDLLASHFTSTAPKKVSAVVWTEPELNKSENRVDCQCSGIRSKHTNSEKKFFFPFFFNRTTQKCVDLLGRLLLPAGNSYCKQ